MRILSMVSGNALSKTLTDVLRECVTSHMATVVRKTEQKHAHEIRYSILRVGNPTTG